MILLQEEQTIQFSPMYVDSSPYWYEELFALYLFLAAIFWVVRAIKLIIALRKLHAIEEAVTAPRNEFHAYWDQSMVRARYLSKLAVLTFFLSVFVASMSLANALLGMVNEKTPIVSFVLIRFGEKLAPFNLGMVVCILLYASGLFFESRLNRRRMRFERSRKTAVEATGPVPTD